MAKNFVSNSPESTRMFKSGFLELLSKIPFYVPIILYMPVIGYFSWKDFAEAHIGIGLFILCFLGGLAVWTITEYVLHRWVFHWLPPGKIGARLHFVFHGVHHDYPSDKMRLVMPPSVSIPLAFLFYGIFYLLFPPQIRYAFFPGFVLGYLIYDISHYAIHHFTFKGGWWKKIKQHHTLHHYSDASKGFGVSSTFWDKVFRSEIVKK